MNPSSQDENMIITISENKLKGRVWPLTGLQTWVRLICTILVVQNFLVTYQVVIASRSNNLYDPEQQDGIPVFSARSIPAQASSSLDDDWGASDRSMGASDQPQVAQRRQGDADLDDGMEDEDDDEYKSGSTQRESVENPSYGESTRSARDGDEIEEFFDKHLGPPQEATSADESSTSVSRQDVPASDPDDYYEAAASGPIANIIHSLLSHNGQEGKHRRPFLKIATTTSASAPYSPSSSSDSTDSSSGSTSSSTSLTSSLPILSLISAAAEKSVDKSAQPGALKTSQSAQSFVKTAPIALAFAPATASSLLAQDSATPEQSTGDGMQEIYIGRRPSVMNYLQKAYAQQQRQQQQQQQQQHAPLGYTTAGSSNLWRGAQDFSPARGQAGTYEQDQMADYARYPIAASYMSQREHSTEAASSLAPDSDDEQTVTYNLSFGGAPTDGDETPPAATASHNLGQDESQAGPDTNEPVPQTPQQAPRGYVPYSTRYSASSTKSHNNYHNSNNNPYQGPYYKQTGDFARAADQPYHPQMLMMQHQHNYRPNAGGMGGAGGSTRYHRDPSDSLNGAAAVQRSQEGVPNQYVGAQYAGTNYSGNLKGDEQADEEQEDVDESASMNKANAQALERQRLLASLDREIKASPHYQSNNAAAGAAATSALARMYDLGSVGKGAGRSKGTPGKYLVASKTLKKSYQGGDLDSYNSFHSEEDPYKSFTSTSRMINDPNHSAHINSASGQIPDTRHGAPIVYGARSGDRFQTADSNFQSNQSLSDEQPFGRLNNTNSPSLVEHSSVPSLSPDWSLQNIDNKQEHSQRDVASQKQRQQLGNSNLLTGPLTKLDATSRKSSSSAFSSSKSNNNDNKSQSVANSRVRREDPDEREIDGDSDDDGVWVDDDEDDDSRQQSSDVNETAQEPEGEEESGEEGQNEDATNSVPNPMRSHQMNPPGVVGGPHGYELSPNDLMIYHG